MNGALSELAAIGTHTSAGPYGVDDWPNFLGRDKESRALAELWISKRLTMLYGSAGIGKTSLVQAGVISLLRWRRNDLFPVGRLTRRSAFYSAPLAQHNPFTLALLSSWAPLEDPSLLSTMTIYEFLRWRRRAAGMSSVLAVIDQAEQLFDSSEAVRRYRKAFLEELSEALENYPDLHILVVIRDSASSMFLSEASSVPEASMELHGLKPDLAIDISRRCLANIDSLLAIPDLIDDLANRLINELLDIEIPDDHGNNVIMRHDSVHPVYLHEVLEGIEDRFSSYDVTASPFEAREILDVDRCLAHFVRRGISSVSRYHELDPGRLLSWLVRIFAEKEGVQIRVNGRHKAVAGMSVPVPYSLEDKYILRSGLRSGIRWFGLQSDRLVKPIRFADEIFTAPALANIVPTFTEHLEDTAVAFANGELERAQRHAQRALQASYDRDLLERAQVEIILGNIAYQNGDIKQARCHYFNSAQLHEAAQIEIAVGRLLTAIGRLHVAEGDIIAAVEAFQSALNRTPTNTIRIELARAFAAAGEWQAAAALLEPVLLSSDDRDVGIAHFLRGEIRADHGNAADALTDLERAAYISQPSISAVRALTLARLSRFAEAAGKAVRLRDRPRGAD